MGLVVIVGAEESGEGSASLLVGLVGAFVGPSCEEGLVEAFDLPELLCQNPGGFCCWRWVQTRSEMRRLSALVASLLLLPAASFRS